LMPPREPTFRDPSVADVLIDSRLMIGLARLCAQLVAGYLFISIVARVRRAQWLSAVGPFKVDESVETMTSDSWRMESELALAKQTIDAQAVTIERLLASHRPGRETVDHERRGGGDD
jgi:hypothetical protein